MELTLQEKLKLIEFFEFLLNEEISKPLGKMNSELVDNYIRILLHLQDKHIELSPEFINEQVRKIFHPEEQTATPEAVKTTKKHFNKKKVWLVAACIAILVALFSIVSVANDWNVFDFLSEKFGSVHSSPVDKGVDFNGITITNHGKTTTYSTVEDALKSEKVDVLYPTFLPNDISINQLTIYKEDNTNKMVYTYNEVGLYTDISFNTSISETTKIEATETKTINSITCYICEISDISSYQIEFEYKGNLYYFCYTDKEELIEIIKNLEEINNEN